MPARWGERDGRDVGGWGEEVGGTRGWGIEWERGAESLLLYDGFICEYRCAERGGGMGE